MSDRDWLYIMSRPSWEEVWYEIASIFAKRSTCPRLHTAAVAVNEANQLIAAGYNGSLAGEAHCDDVGCEMIEGHCLRTNHAEANLVASAARNGISLLGSTVYVLHTPCKRCYKLLSAAGVSKIKWNGDYITNESTITEITVHVNLDGSVLASKVITST